MKILCVADQIDPLVYSNSIKERFADVDLVLSAGDLPLDYLDFIVSSLNKPLFFVYGNHNLKGFSHLKKNANKEIDFDVRENYSYSTGAVHIASKIIKEDGLIIAGLGGSMRYNNGENQYTNFQMNWEIIKLIPKLFFNKLFRGRYLDILLTHASPEGIHDKEDPCHKGFPAFLWFMRKFKPKYLLHGHIHLYDLSEVRTTIYHDTLVINVYSHFILETEDSL
jgi:Icc-related predicted phosphoesterase